MIVEYNLDCLQRKFNKCVANVTIEGETKWRWVQDIAEDGCVYFIGGTAGNWRTQVEGRQNHDFPLVQFNYAPIPIGWMHTNKGLGFLMRKHVGKDYHVGFSFDAYKLLHLYAGNRKLTTEVKFYTQDYYPEKELKELQVGDIRIFSSHVWADGNSLRYLTKEIGFIEKFKCYLNNSSFQPLVKPYLGESWQIVS